MCVNWERGGPCTGNSLSPFSGLLGQPRFNQAYVAREGGKVFGVTGVFCSWGSGGRPPLSLRDWLMLLTRQRLCSQGPRRCSRGPWTCPCGGPSRARENGGLLLALQAVASPAFCRNKGTTEKYKYEVERKQRKTPGDERGSFGQTRAAGASAGSFWEPGVLGLQAEHGLQGRPTSLESWLQDWARA